MSTGTASEQRKTPGIVLAELVNQVPVTKERRDNERHAGDPHRPHPPEQLLFIIESLSW